MNVGGATQVILIFLSLTSTTSIYPHPLGFRVKPQISKTTEESKARQNHPRGGFRLEPPTTVSKTEEQGSRGWEVVECSTKCIGISSASGIPASLRKPENTTLEKRRSSAKFVSSFLDVVTRGLLKKIPIRALVRLAEDEKKLVQMQKITRVQWVGGIKTAKKQNRKKNWEEAPNWWNAKSNKDSTKLTINWYSSQSPITCHIAI